MRKTFKRSILILLILSLVFSLAVLTSCKKKKDKDDDEEESVVIDASIGRSEFIDDIGGVSETYTGAVSEESYETKEEAATAFVSEEIVGTQKTAIIQSTESKGQLSPTEITALNLPEEFSENVESVEKIEVTYSEAELYSRSASESGTKKIIVYIIKIGPDYKYFTPCPVNGDTITKSYYESVFDYEKYDNCTYNNYSYVKVEALGKVMEMTISQTVKRDGNKIYLKQEISGDDELIMSVLYGGVTEYMEVYIERDEEGYKTTWAKMSPDAEWQESYLVFQVDPFAGQDNLDYSYFSKADFGFALKGDNAIRFYKEYTNGSIPEGADSKLALYAEYYVQEGVLTGMRMEYSADITQKSGDMSVRSITTGLNKMSCTDYGTTVVDRPFAE